MRAQIPRGFWYDTALAAGPETFGTLREVADPSRIVFGSDWPFANAQVMAESVRSLTAPGFLSERERTGIDRANALALFPRLAR